MRGFVRDFLGKLFPCIFIMLGYTCNTLYSAELDDQRLQPRRNENGRRQCYDAGIMAINHIEGVGDWNEAIGILKTHGWHRLGDGSHSLSQNEWHGEVDTETLKTILLGACGTIIAATTGGVNIVEAAVARIVECLTAVFRNGQNGALQYVSVGEREIAKTYSITEDRDSQYAIGYFLSVERTATGVLSPVHKVGTRNISCNARVAFFKIIPPSIRQIPDPVPPPPVDLYRNLPAGCTTDVYVALIDKRFKDLNIISGPPEGYGGWCQIVDTRDRAGNVVYTARHFIRNEEGTGFSIWSKQDAEAAIEILVGSNYRGLAQAREIGDVKGEGVHVKRVTSTFKREKEIGDEYLNRHQHWMDMALIGMRMPEALSCERVVKVAKDIIKLPGGNGQRLSYCVYGSSVFLGKVINCVPWPFMFWKNVLGRHVCNENMQQYINFKVWFASCKVEQGYDGFFGEGGRLIEPAMKLVQIQKRPNIHRVWTRSGVVGGREFRGGNEIAYKHDWNERLGEGFWDRKLRDGLIETINVELKDVGCFVE